MSLSTYTGLQAAIADWLNRSDLTSVIPDFIVLTEGRLRRMLRASGAQNVATLSLSAATVSAPTSMKEAISFYLAGGQGSDDNDPIEIVSREQLSAYQNLYTSAGKPKYAAISNGTIYLCPVPDQTYTAKMIYELDVPPLASNSTNWLLTSFPDVYLYGALVEASPYLRDDPRVADFERRFKEAIAELELHRDRMQYGPNTPVIRPKRVFT